MLLQRLDALFEKIGLDDLAAQWTLGGTLTAILLKAAPNMAAIHAAVEAAMVDGPLTGDEARELGVAVSRRVGDLQWMLWGKDILGQDAQEELFGAASRIAWRAIRARQSYSLSHGS